MLGYFPFYILLVDLMIVENKLFTNKIDDIRMAPENVTEHLPYPLCAPGQC